MIRYTEIREGKRSMLTSIEPRVVTCGDKYKKEDFDTQTYFFLTICTEFYRNLLLEMGYDKNVSYVKNQCDLPVSQRRYKYHAITLKHNSLPEITIATYLSYTSDEDYCTIDSILMDIEFEGISRARISVFNSSTHKVINVDKVEHGFYIINAIRDSWDTSKVPYRLIPASELL